MFTLLLFVIFTTCIIAAPTQNQWSKFKEDKSLEHFQSTLLNETILPFLDECYNTTLLAQNHQTEESICSSYFDAILQLNSSGYKVNATTVLNLRDEANATDKFCEQKHNFPTKQNFPNVKPMDLNNLVKCGHSCLEDGGSTTKPICRFLAWMGDEITKNSTGNIKLKVSPDVGNAMTSEATNLAQVDNSLKGPQSNNSLSNKNIDAVQVKTTETIKFVQIAKKPASKSPKALPKPQSNNSSEKPIKEKKEYLDEDKDDIELVNKSADEVKSKVDPRTQPLDKSKDIIAVSEQSLDTAKGSIGLTTSNSSAQDSNKPLQTPELKEEENTMDNSEGIESDGEITNDEEDMDVKNGGVPITNPENDQNHSRSQEIISSKVIETTTTNKKKDPFHEQSGSNFFTYLLVGMFLSIAMYVSYHNKSKILALVLEGRRGDKGRNGRRKHTAAYRKLDSNLEEAITSSARGRTTQIIY